MTIELISPRVDLKDEYRRMIAEYEQVGETYWFFEPARSDFAAFIQGLEDTAQGIGLAEGRVPYHTYWLAEDGSHILGELRLRHHLSPALEVDGGHIGYNIRPSERRKGLGTLQLRLGLEKARELGLKRVMLTCDDDNFGSAKIIEANGGTFTGRVISPRSGKPIRQYWIELRRNEAMFEKHAETGYRTILEGIQLKTLTYGEKTLMAEFLLQKDSPLPRHSHPYEQTGYLVRGRMRLTIAGEPHEVGPGDSWCIPGGVEHMALPLEDSVAIEVFSPVREDYLPK